MENLLPFLLIESQSELYLYLLIFFLTITFLLFFIKTKFFLIDNYSNRVQKIHSKQTSRHGGVVVFFIIFFFSYYLENFILLSLCLIYILNLIISFIEDSYHLVTPAVRLISIIFTSSLTIYFINNLFGLPTINIPFTHIKIINPVLMSFILIFFMSSIISGANLIDGANGLCSLSFISILVTLYFFAAKSNDLMIINSLHIILPALIGFLVLNFPKGKIFLGDNGAYFLGFITCSLIFIFIVNNPNLSSWAIIALLFYPGFEVFFSFIRKLFLKKNPFKADDMHLHLIAFRVLNAGIKKDWLANSLVTIFLVIVWLVPCILVLIFNNSTLSIFIVLTLSIYIYLSIYIAVKNGIKE